ncbi:MAG TPA: STAS domain-containing protein [Candidatus Binatia bacterium]|nr:STAS domain-containing protein [Candidatus Binatia bacterium]
MQEQPGAALTIRGPLARADLPGLCQRVGQLLGAGQSRLVDCYVSDVAADAVTVDALARLQLAVKRHGCRVRLRCPSKALAEIVALMGLDDVLIE